MTVGTAQTFTATLGGATGVPTWSAPSGGSVTTAGKFTAPATPGTAKVRATAPDAAFGEATITVVASPKATLTAASPVTVNTAGLVASVPVQTGVSYTWTLTGGTITSGLGTNQIAYTAGAAGTASLQCQVTNAAGTVATGTKAISIVAAPELTGFSATQTTLTAGTGTTLTGAFANATGSVDQGVGVVTNGFEYSVFPTQTTTYTLTVKNTAGTTKTAQVTIVVAAGPKAVISTWSQVATGATGIQASVPTQAGMTYAWAISGGTLTSGASTSTVTYDAGEAGALALSCTVTNAAGNTVVGTKDVVVTAAPVATIIAPSTITPGTTGWSAYAPLQPGVTYAWSISGGTISSSVTGQGVTFQAAGAGPVGLTCVVTTTSGVSATGQFTVNQDGGRDVSGTYTYYYAGAMTLHQTGTQIHGDWSQNVAGFLPRKFSGTFNGTTATGTWTANNGTDSGLFVFTFNASGTQFSATWGSGSSSTGNVATANKGTGLAIELTPLLPALPIGNTVGFSASVAGSLNKAVTWTTTGGSISAQGLYSAPYTPGLYTVTATSLALTTLKTSTNVMVTTDGLLNIAGTYNYYYAGSITLYQAGTQINGVWSQNFANFPARTFSGTFDGTTARGTWTANNGTTNGAFVFTFAPSGTQFTASWGTGTSSTGNTFSASRITGVSGQIFPQNPILRTGGTQSFSALVAGSYNQSVTWYCTGGVVTQAGLYTAPTAPGIYTVGFSCDADPSKKTSTLVSATEDGVFDVTGLYTHYYASNIRLYQSGNQVVGDWWQNFNSFPARALTGTINGRLVTGTWITADGKSSGTYSFTVTPDKASMTGVFYTDGSSVPTSVTANRNANIAIRILPAATVLDPGESKPFNALVAGSFDKRYTLGSSSPASLSPSGVFTAPQAFGVYTVTATSLANPAATSTGTIQVTIKVALTPASASVLPGQTVSFHASNTQLPTVPVTWSIVEGSAGGSINSAGVYTAPTTSGIFHVMARSTQDPTSVTLAAVTVHAPAPVRVSIAPGQMRMTKGAQQIFVAVVDGSENNAVTWTATAGTIDGLGNYTAPTAFGTYTVTATSVADPTAYAEATIVVAAQAGLDKAFTYDLNGNLTDDGDRSFEWDAENRLVAVTIKATGHRSEFGYDGLGRRVAITEKDPDATHTLQVTSDKKYMWDGTDIAQELSADGATVTKRFYPQGFVDNDGTTLFYTRDHLGSIRELTDSSQAVRARYDYDPYGRMTKISGDRDSVFGYTGYFWHAASKLNLAMFRAYDPNLGRWISTDPIEENGGVNLFNYVANDPINLVDILGLDSDGGPYHPPAGVKLKCYRSDSCSTLRGKIFLFNKMINSHQGWDWSNAAPRGGNRHCEELADLWSGYANCQSLYAKKNCSSCPNPGFPSPSPIPSGLGSGAGAGAGIGAAMVIGLIFICVLCPECCMVAGPVLAF